ncbi:MAG: hypothetical protein ACLFVH_09255 [Phycisphaerae bacterium]
MIETLAQALEPAIEACGRCGRHRPGFGQAQPPSRLAAQQSDPGVVITHGLGQVDAGLLDQAAGVVFGHDELVDIANAQQHAIDMIEPVVGSIRFAGRRIGADPRIGLVALTFARSLETGVFLLSHGRCASAIRASCPA